MPQPSQQQCWPRAPCLTPDKEALGAAELSPPCLSAGPPCRTHRTGPVVLPCVWGGTWRVWRAQRNCFPQGRQCSKGPMLAVTGSACRVTPEPPCCPPAQGRVCGAGTGLWWQGRGTGAAATAWLLGQTAPSALLQTPGCHSLGCHPLGCPCSGHSWGNTGRAVELTQCLLAPHSSPWQQDKALPPRRAATEPMGTR